MSAKAILILCAQALFVQSAFSQCFSHAAVEASGFGGPYGLADLGGPYGLADLGGPYGLADLGGPYGLADLGGPYGLAGSGLSAAYGYDGIAGPGLAYNGFATGRGLAYDGLNAGCAGRGLAYDGCYAPTMEFTATSGGALPVTSSSAIAPTGISVVSENAFEGILSMAGELPFVGTTVMEGAIASGGAGAVNYACGNGVTAMASEGGYTPATGFAPGIGSLAPGAYRSPAFGPASFGGRFGSGGCGCDIIY